ncbi:MAG: hypothetical protein VCD00_15430 [Candidatus Hydrogenedentota bacterium]
MNETYFALITASLLVMIVSGCSLLFFLLRNARLGGGGMNATSGDLTNMMILFQSMRETVEQQKELARQLNLSIDRKVADVRTTIESAGALKASVTVAQTELDELLRDTKEQLASLNRRMGYLNEQLPGGDDSGVDSDVEESDAPTETKLPEPDARIGTPVPFDDEDDHVTQVAPLPPLNAIASKPTRKPDFIDNWAGVDFGATEAPEPARLPEPLEPDDPEASRDAFRALLDMKTNDSAADFAEVTAGGNALEQSLTPVQRRIYEFSDAGMRIPEIARELGVGKGEIKLILNMREKQA